jgi:hypothetical protein
MKENHSTIILDYVSGGCTGVAQPCNVGAQHVFKHAVKRAYHQDIVNELLSQPDAGKENLVVDNWISVHQDQSVQWLWNGWKALSNRDLVKKVCTHSFWHCASSHDHPIRPSNAMKFGSGTYHMIH